MTGVSRIITLSILSIWLFLVGLCSIFRFSKNTSDFEVYCGWYIEYIRFRGIEISVPEVTAMMASCLVYMLLSSLYKQGKKKKKANILEMIYRFVF